MLVKPVTQSGGRKPKGQGLDRRREILEAAREIYLADGYELTTIRRVGQKVGVSSTALYVYFKDKDDLIRAVCDEILGPLYTATIQLGALSETLNSAASVEAILRQFSENYIRFGLSHPMVYYRIFMDPKQLTWNHHTGTHEGGEVDPKRFNPYAFAEGMVRRGQELGLVKAGDPTLLTEVAWAALHGAVAIRVTDPKAPYAPVDDHIREIIDMIVRGLRP
jgi:AcrR family transcriptional regulator